MTDQQVVLTATFTALSGKAEEVAELIRGLAADVRDEPGNVVFDVYRLDENSDGFFVFEVYEDRAAFEAHIGADYGAVFNAALRARIVEDGSQLTFLRGLDVHSV